jgi:hypothetical protein
MRFHVFFPPAAQGKLLKKLSLRIFSKLFVGRKSRCDLPHHPFLYRGIAANP